MEGKQLSLFPDFEYRRDKNYHKKAKLGRYEKIQYKLNNNENDPYYQSYSDANFVPYFTNAEKLNNKL